MFLIKICFKLQVDPYENFLLKQCKKMLFSHRMLAVCQALPMTAPTERAVKNKLLNNGMKLQFFNNRLIRYKIVDSDVIYSCL